MKNIFKNVTLALLLVFAITGCSLSGGAKSEENIQSENTETQTQNNIILNGSTSMKKLATALSEAYMEINPESIVTVEFTGSGAGIQSVLNATSHIANSSRNLTEEELAAGLVENKIAIDAIAIVTDNKNSVEDLTKEQLRGIFEGNIKNWSEVGGADQNIVVIGRENGSGTRSAFEELLEIQDKAVYAQEIDSTGAVVAKVASIPGAISYVSLDVISDNIKPLKIEGFGPSEENILNNSYFLSRYFIMATKGGIEEQPEHIQNFFRFVYSEEAKELIKKVGLIPVE